MSTSRDDGDRCQACNKTHWPTSVSCRTFVTAKMVGWTRDIPEQLHAQMVEQMWNYCGVTDTACWSWQRRLTPTGYGTISIPRGRQAPLHRASWIIFRGPIPLGLMIDHKCQNRSCFNPWHLEPVTPEINYRRAAQPGLSRYSDTNCRRGHPWTADTTFWEPLSAWGACIFIKRICTTCVNDPTSPVDPLLKWYRRLLGPSKQSQTRRAKMAIAVAQYLEHNPILAEPTVIGYLINPEHMKDLARDEKLETIFYEDDETGAA